MRKRKCPSTFTINNGTFQNLCRDVEAQEGVAGCQRLSERCGPGGADAVVAAVQPRDAAAGDELRQRGAAGVPQLLECQFRRLRRLHGGRQRVERPLGACGGWSCGGRSRGGRRWNLHWRGLRRLRRGRGGLGGRGGRGERGRRGHGRGRGGSGRFVSVCERGNGRPFLLRRHRAMTMKFVHQFVFEQGPVSSRARPGGAGAARATMAEVRRAMLRGCIRFATADLRGTVSARRQEAGAEELLRAATPCTRLQCVPCARCAGSVIVGVPLLTSNQTYSLNPKP